jgi:2'-5' RNA ligase
VSEPVRRLFFALWPDQALNARLIEVTEPARRKLGAAGARLVDTANVHITLAFLGNLAAEQYQCVASAADQVHASSFDLLLDRWGYFRKAQVASLAPSGIPGGLKHLVDRLWVAAESCGLRPDNRPYRPHLTLARKVTARLDFPPPESVLWRPVDFVLVASVTHASGPEYRVLKRWPLSTGELDHGPE